MRNLINIVESDSETEFSRAFIHRLQDACMSVQKYRHAKTPDALEQKKIAHHALMVIVKDGVDYAYHHMNKDAYDRFVELIKQIIAASVPHEDHHEFEHKQQIHNPTSSSFYTPTKKADPVFIPVPHSPKKADPVFIPGDHREKKPVEVYRSAETDKKHSDSRSVELRKSRPDRMQW